MLSRSGEFWRKFRNHIGGDKEEDAVLHYYPTLFLFKGKQKHPEKLRRYHCHQLELKIRDPFT